MIARTVPDERICQLYEGSGHPVSMEKDTMMPVDYERSFRDDCREKHRGAIEASRIFGRLSVGWKIYDPIEYFLHKSLICCSSLRRIVLVP